jgi:hypothetical protein
VTIAAAICFVIALIAELAGIGLVLQEASKAQEALKRWRGPASVRELDAPMAAFRRRDILTAHVQQEADDEVIALLLGNQANRRLAVVLLFGGVSVGTLGNFLSLSW